MSLDARSPARRPSPVVPWLVAALLPLVAGCASRWEQAYVGARAAALAGPEAVEVRDVPAIRMDRTLGELEAIRAATDIPPDEWTPEEKAASKALLLRGLQVTEDPTRVQVLGSSRFRTTDRLRMDDPALRAFAARIGADRVVVSSQWLGKADRIVNEPVTTFGGGWGYFYDNPWRGPSWSSGTGTTWVPVRVQVDETGWVVFFLRVG